VLQSVGSPTASSSSSFSYPRVDSLPSVAAGAGKAPEAALLSQIDLNEVVVSCFSETTNTMTTAAASESDSPRRRFSSDDGGVAVKGSEVAGGGRGQRHEEEKE
ncbi:unnamed protein product, partial [Ectocarpus sp. 12 AP-2014]